MLVDTVEIEHYYETEFDNGYAYGIDAITYLSYWTHLRKKLRTRLAININKAIMINTFLLGSQIHERVRRDKICL